MASRVVWTKDDDATLIDALSKCKKRKWSKIASQIFDNDKTAKDCRIRYKQLNPKYRLFSRPFTKGEDRKLKRLVFKRGRNWKLFVKYFTNRTGRQLREHYINTLDISPRTWTENETIVFKQLQQMLGNKWVLISKHLGRCENDVKNQWYSLKRKEQTVERLKQQQIDIVDNFLA